MTEFEDTIVHDLSELIGKQRFQILLNITVKALFIQNFFKIVSAIISSIKTARKEIENFLKDGTFTKEKIPNIYNFFHTLLYGQSASIFQEIRYKQYPKIIINIFQFLINTHALNLTEKKVF